MTSWLRTEYDQTLRADCGHETSELFHCATSRCMGKRYCRPCFEDVSRHKCNEPEAA
jgi:hypothetical protein